jgi:hypothetical protein
MTPESSNYFMSDLPERFVHHWNKDKTIESACTVCYATVCREASLLLVRECEDNHRCPGRPDMGQPDASSVDVNDGWSVRKPKASEPVRMAPVSRLLNALEWTDPSLNFVCPICGAQPHSQCERHNRALHFESHIERWDGLNPMGTSADRRFTPVQRKSAKLSKQIEFKR